MGDNPDKRDSNNDGQPGGVTPIGTDRSMTTLDPELGARLIVEAREAARLLTMEAPTCNCTGWYDTPDGEHERSCLLGSHQSAVWQAIHRASFDSFANQLEAALTEVRRLHNVEVDGAPIPVSQSVNSRSVMTADEQTLHRLIEHQRTRGVPETSIVRALGLALGFGRLMQLTEQSWRELAVQRDVPGTEFTVGPCARELVPCPHPASSLNVNGHCDWCCGDGRVTARVRRAIKEVDSPTTGTEPVTHTEPAIQLVWYRRPDGRWNADCACGATVCGILEGERWTYEDWHLAHAQEERAHGQERQPCGPKLPDPNPNFPGPPVFR